MPMPLLSTENTHKLLWLDVHVRISLNWITRLPHHNRNKQTKTVFDLFSLSVLKVYSIDADGFSEVCNMRGGKNQNLSYSSNDVAWSVLDSNLLATAATNGVVSVWDLSKFGRQKQLYVYSEHERTAHTVTFHATEPNLLISGSQDGTIKCFDLRVDKAVFTYCSNSESVRDVKFSPQYPNTFAAVSESGTIQLWDLKRWVSFRLISGFLSHAKFLPDPINASFNSPHIRDRYTRATGIRHNLGWQLGAETNRLRFPVCRVCVCRHAKPEYSLFYTDLEYGTKTDSGVHHTHDSRGWTNSMATRQNVSHRQLCPCRRQFVSFYFLFAWMNAELCHYPNRIYVWDIRRPYIPYVAFNKHTNVTTGIAWKGNDPHILYSSSKDSTVHKHSFRDAIRPNDRANPQSTSISHTGDMLFSYKIKNLQPVTVPSTSRTSFMTWVDIGPSLPDHNFEFLNFTVRSRNSKYCAINFI